MNNYFRLEPHFLGKRYLETARDKFCSGLRVKIGCSGKEEEEGGFHGEARGGPLDSSAIVTRTLASGAALRQHDT